MEWYVALALCVPLVILFGGAYVGMRQKERANEVDVKETLTIIIRHMRMLLPDDKDVFERILTTYIDAYRQGLIREHPLLTFVETKVEEEHLFQLLTKDLTLAKRCAVYVLLNDFATVSEYLPAYALLLDEIRAPQG